MKAIKLLLFATLATVLAGCKLAVIVVEGGEVQSTASGTCMPSNSITGTICIHQINDTNYSETFTAVADPGWEFVKWNTGGDFFCPGNTSPTCVVSNVLLAGNPTAEAVVASDQAFYVMPIFTEVGLPINDTVTVDGKEWAQVDLFLDLTWDEINAICPAGICGSGVLLNGFDMGGWTWANVDDLNSLFNSYIGSAVLGPGPDEYYQKNSLWAPAFFADGLRPTVVYSVGQDLVRGMYINGYTSSSLPCDTSRTCANGAMIYEHEPADVNDEAKTITQWYTDIEYSYIGAWFYRTP